MDSKHKYFCGECDREFHSPVLECLWCGSPAILDISLREISSPGGSDEEANSDVDVDVDQYEYFCSECEAEVAESSDFCPSCGAYIGDADLVTDDEVEQTTAHLPEDAYKDAFRSWAERDFDRRGILFAVLAAGAAWFLSLIVFTSLIPLDARPPDGVMGLLSLVVGVLVLVKCWPRSNS